MGKENKKMMIVKRTIYENGDLNQVERNSKDINLLAKGILLVTVDFLACIIIHDHVIGKLTKRIESLEKKLEK